MPRELERVQRWMQAVVTHPGDVQQALAAPEAARELPPERLSELVSPSWSMEPAQRVGVYHGMYLLRMAEALQVDYPVLHHTLGEEAFLELVTAYVQAHPSRSYTLNRLGDHLPDFIAARKAGVDTPFLADLARFELGMTQVFDEEESSVLTAEELQAIDPELWDRLRLRPIAAFRLLSLRYAVVPHLEAYHAGRPVPRPRRRATWVALHRRNFKVFHLELSRPEAELLGAIVSGTPLADALEQAAARIRSTRRQQTIFQWFRDWVAAGLFTAAEV